MKKEIKLPKFKSEDEEYEFWSKLDLTEYFEPGDFVPVIFPNLKPSTTSISIRLPNHLLARLKEKANAQDVPYQSLIKIYLADRLRDEYRGSYHVNEDSKTKPNTRRKEVVATEENLKKFTDSYSTGKNYSYKKRGEIYHKHLDEKYGDTRNEFYSIDK